MFDGDFDIALSKRYAGPRTRSRACARIAVVADTMTTLREGKITSAGECF
jgi:hypothetical protein